MSNLNRALKRWEEHVISHEKGNRIVQYRVVDNNRNSILAVVGRERGQRHMTYTMMGDLFCVFGPVSKVPAGTKWTSRKTVVDFLSSLISSSGPILANSNQRRIGLATYPKKEWIARFDSESNKWTSEEELAAEGICSLRQVKKAHVEGEIVLWAPQISSESEESRDGAWLSPGLSATGNKRPNSSSATVDSKQRRRIAGVEPSRPNGSSAASEVPHKAGIRRVPKSKDRRA